MTQLHYQDIGDGTPLVLIHGLFGSLENLNMVAKRLSEHYRVISVDVRNHGNSFHSPQMNYKLMSQDIINLLDDLALNSTHMLGHSMGGKVAMQCTLSFPERINKLIVADISPVEYQPSHLKIIAGLKAIDLSIVQKRSDADKQLANYVDEVSTRQFLLKNLSFNNTHAQWRSNINAIADNYATLIGTIKGNSPTPNQTLFIKGGNSDYIKPEHREDIVRIFPNSKAKIIQGTGHWLHAEKTVAFNKIVHDFLS